jgi:hypothetical protein
MSIKEAITYNHQKKHAYTSLTPTQISTLKVLKQSKDYHNYANQQKPWSCQN